MRKDNSYTREASSVCYQDRWRSLEPDRLERYKALFEYRPAADPLIAPADIGDGHVVVDLGCGPGSLSAELAKRVGPRGHVHAIDVNADFVQLARERVSREGVGDRVTVHLVDDWDLAVAAPCSAMPGPRASGRSACRSWPARTPKGASCP